MGRLYAGQSAQDRVDSRRRRLIEAAITEAAARGLADMTVRGVCDQAGLSTRFFYEGFESLETLLTAAYDECVEHAFTTIYDAVAATGPASEERAHAAINAIVDYLDTYPQRARLVFIDALGSHVLASKRQAALHLQAQLITALARASYPVNDEDPRVRVTARLVAGAVTELMIGWLDGSLDVPREQLIDHCARVLVAIGDAGNTLTPIARPAVRPGRNTDGP